MNPADSNPTTPNPAAPPPPPTIPTIPTIPTATPSASTQQTVVSQPPSDDNPKKMNKKALLFAGLALVLTVGTVFTALALTRRNQSEQTGATEQTTLACRAIKIHDEAWADKTSSTQDLKPGQKIRLVAEGSGSQALYSAARFSINGSTMTETLLRKPQTNEFYYEYEIPASGVSEFNIEAEVKGLSNNIWY